MLSEIVQIKSFPLRSLFELTLTAVALRASVWGTIFRIVRKLAWIFSICIKVIMISPSTVMFWKDLESQPLQELLLSRNAYVHNLPTPCFVEPFSSPFIVDEHVRLCLTRTGALGPEGRSRVWTRPGEVKTPRPPPPSPPEQILLQGWGCASAVLGEQTQTVLKGCLSGLSQERRLTWGLFGDSQSRSGRR